MTDNKKELHERRLYAMTRLNRQLRKVALTAISGGIPMGMVQGLLGSFYLNAKEDLRLLSSAALYLNCDNPEPCDECPKRDECLSEGSEETVSEKPN